MKSMKKLAGVLIVSAAFTFSNLNSHAQNFLIDPGFENQTSTAAGGWFSFGGNFSTDYSHTGHWSMFDQAYYSVPGTFEQFPAAPGSKWQMTGYGLTPTLLLGFPALGEIQITFFDIFGNDLGTVETAGNPFPAKTSNPVDGSATPGVWNFLDTGVATAPAGTAYIQAFTLYIDFSGNVQGVYFDDVTLQVLVKNHGQYISSIANNAQMLLNAGFITAAQADAMIGAAAKSGGGK